MSEQNTTTQVFKVENYKDIVITAELNWKGKDYGRVEITKFDKQNGVSGFHVILEFGKTHYVGAGKDNPKLKDFKNFEITLPIAK